MSTESSRGESALNRVLAIAAVVISLIGVAIGGFFSYRSDQSSAQALKLSKAQVSEQESFEGQNLDLSKQAARRAGVDLETVLGLDLFNKNDRKLNQRYFGEQERTTLPADFATRYDVFVWARFNNLGNAPAKIIDVGLAVSKDGWAPVESSKLFCEIGGLSTDKPCRTPIIIDPGSTMFITFELNADLLDSMDTEVAAHSLQICYDASTTGGCTPDSNLFLPPR